MGGILRADEITEFEEGPTQEAASQRQSDECILDYLSRDVGSSTKSVRTPVKDTTSNSINFEDDFDDCETSPLKEKLLQVINESTVRLSDQVKEEIKDECSKVQARSIADFTVLKTTADREDCQRWSQVAGAVEVAVTAVTKAYEDIAKLQSGLEEASVRGQTLQRAVEDVQTRLEQHASVQTNSLKDMASEAKAVKDLTMSLYQSDCKIQAAHVDLSKMRVKYGEILDKCRFDAKQQNDALGCMKRAFEGFVEAENRRASDHVQENSRISSQIEKIASEQESRKTSIESSQICQEIRKMFSEALKSSEIPAKWRSQFGTLVETKAPEGTGLQCNSSQLGSPLSLKYWVMELEDKLRELEISGEQIKEDQETWETTQQVYQRDVEVRLRAVNAKEEELAQAQARIQGEIQSIRALQQDECIMTDVDVSKKLNRLVDEFRALKCRVDGQDPYEPVIIVLFALGLIVVLGVAIYCAVA